MSLRIIGTYLQNYTESRKKRDFSSRVGPRESAFSVIPQIPLATSFGIQKRWRMHAQGFELGSDTPPVFQCGYRVALLYDCFSAAVMRYRKNGFN
jgi:hypothetical protein